MSEEVKSLLERTGLEPKLVNEILTVGRMKKVKADSVVMSPEMEGDEMPIILEGLLKVMRQNEKGQDIFLYYLEGGETCAMSITCCIEGKRASFRVLAEEDSILWMVPMSNMDRWVANHTSFRRFIFSSYQTRFDELLNTIDSVVFHKMDERLYRYLLDTKQATGSFEINKTHAQIAHELNTSRVVVSRLLKQLEREDKIEQRRNKIEIL